jgi:hypothetical protein
MLTEKIIEKNNVTRPGCEPCNESWRTTTAQGEDQSPFKLPVFAIFNTAKESVE